MKSGNGFSFHRALKLLHSTTNIQLSFGTFFIREKTSMNEASQCDSLNINGIKSRAQYSDSRKKGFLFWLRRYETSVTIVIVFLPLSAQSTYVILPQLIFVPNFLERSSFLISTRRLDREQFCPSIRTYGARTRTRAGVTYRTCRSSF